MKKILAFLIILVMVVMSGCGLIQNARPGLSSISSYKDIPGITQEEISSIESLKTERGVFSYGHLLGSESFMLPDGTYTGFTDELCNLLSDLFGIEFVRMYYDEWENLKSDIDSHALDFSSLSVHTDGYYKTSPISGRGMKIYTLTSSEPLVTESDADGLRIGFLKGTTAADIITTCYPALSFEAVEAANYDSAVELLNANRIDAFVMTEEKGYKGNEFIREQSFFSLAYTPVSITTSNPELELVIKVIDKYLASGGKDALFTLHNDEKYAYKRYQLYQTFTDAEKAYIQDMKSRGAKVDIGIQHDVYPVSFYNEKEKQFEGIVIDLLAEISKLTDLEFDTITTTKDTTLAEILGKLKNGEISMMTQLLYTDSRKNDYIWSSNPYLTSNYALLSNSELPNLESYQVYFMRVGTVNKSAHEEMFNRWFPGHPNRTVYNTTSEGFDALERGDIDLLMLCESMLLTLTNYREQSGYKVNLSFNEALDSLLGFSKDEEILRSIVDKAFAFTDVDQIANGWMSRNFDYSHQMAQEQMIYLSIFSIASFAMLVTMIVLFVKNKRLRMVLMERSAKLSAIYSSIPDTMFTKNTDGVYTSCNPSFEKQAGLPEAEIINKTYAEVFRDRVSDTITQYRDTDGKVMRERSVEIVEEMVVFPDGSRRALEILKAPLIHNGNVVGLLGIGRDVTERNEIEGELHHALASVQDSVAMLEYIINTAQIAFAMSMDNIITQVNEYSRSFIGMNIGDDIRSFYTDIAQRAEIIEALEHENMISNVVMTLRLVNGESHRFLASVSGFQYEQRKAFIIWAMDIEDDEQKNDQIHVTQESLQAILDTLPAPVRIFDMETMEIVYVNDSFLELLGYDSAEELSGLRMQDMLAQSQGNGKSAIDCVNEVRSTVTAKPVAFPRDYRTKTGKVIETEVVIRLIDYKGRPSSIGIMKDLTEEKERAQFLLNAAEREREANQSKSRFLASMSHEIRTPMNAIIGMSELLLKEPLTSRQQGYANDINISSHSLLSIINDILDLSKIEAGKLELTPVHYDFQTLIDNIHSMFQFVAQEKGLAFSFETEGNIPKCLFGDDVRLRQVLTNICGNAVKFTSKGYVRLKVTSTENTLVFEIADSGMGIHKEDLPKLFEAFVQADMQKNRNIKGTGLGLSISKAFIEMMNGTITADSVYGQGTVFTITIPKIPGDESAVQNREKESNAKSFFAPSAKVLVVDDNQLNLKVAYGLLNLYKIDADMTLSGREAIELVKATDYDIVFMDHMMPEMDGIEATNEIRNMGGKYKELTIIALTANAVRGAKELFLSNEFNDFISKPIEVDTLVDILLEWLPRDKIEMQSEAVMQEAENEGNGHFLQAVKMIQGINTEIGLSRISGMEKMYRETLEMFTKKLLQDCDKMERCLEQKDIHNFAILVHGMKSSLATIGAMELSEKAFIFETAAKNKEFDYCESHLPGFLKNLRFLHEQLSEIMPEQEDDTTRPEGSIETLRKNIQAAQEAVDDFDSNIARQMVNELLEYDYGVRINELLKTAASELRDFDFDAASLSLNSITDTLQ